MNKVVLLLLGCWLIGCATGRSLLEEPYDTLKEAIANPSIKTCGNSGKCDEGYVCKPTEATRCTRDVTPKTECSKEKVCVSGSTNCGNSVCSVDEKCLRADSCKPDFEEIKAAVKSGNRDKIKFSLDPDCWVCKPRETCIERTTEECYEDPDDCEEVACEDLEKVCETTTVEKCETVVQPVCTITTKDECKDVETEVCSQVVAKACAEIAECVKPEPSCKTASVEVCEPAKSEECNCELVTKPVCDEEEECSMYPKTVCKKNAEGVEECTSEEEEKCETVEKNCVDVEEEVCDEGCDEDEKAPVCTQKDETVCVELEPVCTYKPDEDCEPEYKEECTKEVENVCTPVEFEECTDEKVEDCKPEPVETCKYVPSKKCEGMTKVCKEKCEAKTTKDCNPPAAECNGSTCSEGQICDYKCEVTYGGESVCTKEQLYRCIPEWAADKDP